MSGNTSMDKGEKEVMDFRRLDSETRYTFALKLDKSGEATNIGLWKPMSSLRPRSILEMCGEEMPSSDSSMVRQSLHIERIILGKDAKDNELNLVSAEVNNVLAPVEYRKSSFPMAYLTKGKEWQSSMHLSFPYHYFGSEVNVKFELTEGSGPVHIIGYHLVEPQPIDYPDDSEDEAEEVTDEEEGEIPTAPKEVVKAENILLRAKRRIKGQNGDAVVEDAIAAKKLKIETKNGTTADTPAPGGPEEMDADTDTKK